MVKKASCFFDRNKGKQTDSLTVNTGINPLFSFKDFDTMENWLI